MAKKAEWNEYRIIDVDEETKESYCVCLEGWSEEMQEAGDRKCLWYERMKDKGLGVKLVQDETGVISGMIQYIPSEYAPIEGDGLYYIYCIWVHGHKQGIGDKRKKGLGTALLQAAEEDIKARGAAGIVTWGITLPFWMRAAWYRKHGYRVVQRDSMSRLLFKSLREDASPPRWYIPKKKDIPEKGVLVTSIVNGICPGMNLANLRAKEVVEEYSTGVTFREIVTDDPAVMREWGISDALYVNGKTFALGPPLQKNKLRKMIDKEMRRNR